MVCGLWKYNISYPVTTSQCPVLLLPTYLMRCISRRIYNSRLIVLVLTPIASDSIWVFIVPFFLRKKNHVTPHPAVYSEWGKKTQRWFKPFIAMVKTKHCDGSNQSSQCFILLTVFFFRSYTAKLCVIFFLQVLP